jgi:DNA-binding transcriptional LysR family regulator
MKPVHVARTDLNLLVVLDAIASEGGVTRAGEKLNLTQSAVSHALARLRDILDDPLFVRQGHTLRPTPLTRAIVEPLRQNLQSLGKLLTEAGGFDPAKSTTRFTVSLRDPLEALVLPPLMASLTKAAPGVDVRTTQVRRRNVEDALAAGSLDLAIDVALPLSGAVHRQLVTTGPLVAIARKGHPALRRGLTLATYVGQQHVMVTSRRRGPGLEDIALSEQGRTRRIRLRCRNYFAALRVVAETDLLLTMPGRQAPVLNASFGNQILPLPVKTPRLDLFLFWHASADRDPANRWLRGLVRQAFEGTRQRR